MKTKNMIRMRIGLLALSCGILGAVKAVLAQPSVVGQWGPILDWSSGYTGTPRDPTVHTHLLPTGKVMVYPVYDGPRLWDPISGGLTWLPIAGFNAFCGGHSHIPDGRLLVMGGTMTVPPFNTGNRGEDKAAYFDPFNNTWTMLPNMTGGRWYPTSTTLANGDVLVTSGLLATPAPPPPPTPDPGPDINPLPQVWQVACGTWRNLTSAQLVTDVYARTFLAPNGKVFFATHHPSQYLDTSGSGSWVDLNPPAHPQFIGHAHYYGSACMDDSGNVYSFGGSDGGAPWANCEKINLNAQTPQWATFTSMPQARHHHNATILPDGKFLITGGSASTCQCPTSGNYNDGPKNALLYNPSANTWTTLALEGKFRGYHSCAVLLPDGRVLSCGGNTDTGIIAQDVHAQVFSPPYLFNGARPTITSAPTLVRYGETFFVGTPSTITKVTWTRLGSVTHAFNWDQRINVLSFSPVTGGLNVTAPNNFNVCPPGYYMLWLLNSAGVPSVSRIVRISGSGQLDSSFNPGTGANAEVKDLTVQPDGKIVIAGTFTQVNGITRNYIARLNSDGSLDQGFSPSLNSWVYALALQPDGKIIVGGWFTQVNGQAHNALVRLNPDGTTDSAALVTSAQVVYDIAIQPDGKIIAVGASAVSGFLARYWPDGSIENSSISTDTPQNYTVALQSDGKILLGGTFYNVIINNTYYPRRCIARLSADFTLDQSFMPTLDSGESELTAIAVQPDGKILIGGWFDLVNGVPSHGIARLDSAGNLDETCTFGPEVNSVKSLVYRTDGKIYFGGWSGLGRLNLDGTLDAVFNPGTGLQDSPWSGYANAIAQQPDGKIIVGGGFSTYNGTSRNNIVRIHGN